MTFEDIAKANKTLSTLDVKGKDYVQVNERIKAFRMLYPEGTIYTEILSLEDGVVTMKATVSYGELVLGVGHAQEKESSSYINKTSFIENCETSAVGRALGMLGIGIDTSVASAEEVQNAIMNQDTKTTRKTISAATVKALKTRIAEEGYTEEYICNYYKVSDISELTDAQHKKIIEFFEGRKKNG